MSLFDYFEALKSVLHLHDLELRWLPGKGGKYRGLVSKDLKTIFVFDEDEDDAKETLLHEVIDLLVTQLSLFILKGDDNYTTKEVVVETLRKLMNEDTIKRRGLREMIIRELKELGDEDLIE